MRALVGGISTGARSPLQQPVDGYGHGSVRRLPAPPGPVPPRPSAAPPASGPDAGLGTLAVPARTLACEPARETGIALAAAAALVTLIAVAAAAGAAAGRRAARRSGAPGVGSRVRPLDAS